MCLSQSSNERETSRHADARRTRRDRSRAVELTRPTAFMNGLVVLVTAPRPKPLVVVLPALADVGATVFGIHAVSATPALPGSSRYETRRGWTRVWAPDDSLA